MHTLHLSPCLDGSSDLACHGKHGREHWLLRGYGPYAVEEKATRILLGTVGPWYPIEWPEPEIKWALARRHWAVRAVQRMALQHVPQMRLISLFDSRNEASIRLALAVRHAGAGN